MWAPLTSRDLHPKGRFARRPAGWATRSVWIPVRLYGEAPIAEDGAFARVDLRPQGQERQEGGQVACVGHFPHQPAHFDVLALASGVALPIYPYGSCPGGLHRPRPVDPAAKVGLPAFIAVEVGEGGDATQQCLHEQGEGRPLANDLPSMLDARGGEKLHGEPVGGKGPGMGGEARRIHGQRAGVDVGRADGLVDGGLLVAKRIDRFDPCQVTASPAAPAGQVEIAAEAVTAQLLKGDEEVGQVLLRPAHEHDMEIEAVAGEEGGLLLRRCLDDEGPGRVLVLAEHLGLGGHGRLKDVGVGAGMAEQAVTAGLDVRLKADHPLEGVTEAPAQGAALVGGQQHGVIGGQGEAVTGEGERSR